MGILDETWIIQEQLRRKGEGGGGGGGGGILPSIHSINIEAARLHKAGAWHGRQAGRSGKENDSFHFRKSNMVSVKVKRKN